jgi:hypothetical protein
MWSPSIFSKMKNTDINRVTKSELSRLLACCRTTITRHLARSDAPRARKGLFDRGEAVRYLRTHITKGGASSELEKLRTRRLELEIEKVELELAKSRGEVVVLANIRPVMAALVAEFQEGLYERFTRQAPARCVGKGVTEVTLLLQDHCDQLIHQWKTGGKKFIAEVGGPAASGKGYG